MTQNVESHKVAFRHQLYGYVLGLGSTGLCMFPEPLDPTTNKQAPRPTRARWRPLQRYVAQSVRQTWVHHDGITDAGRFPKGYPLAQIIDIDREAMDRLQLLHNGRHAVTYKLISAMMVGTSRIHEIYGLAHPDAKDYQVAMNVGGGPFDSGVGILSYVGSSYYRTSMYWGLDHGVRKGEVMPPAELPPYIPAL